MELTCENTHTVLPYIDLVTARREFYTYPTALPTVERGSIKLDLHRRDFTINTLALRLDGAHYGELHDYWGGLKDLDNGRVRVLHSLSFVDDPTRMLRAVRFEQRFEYTIENRTMQLLNEAISLLHPVSGDRIRHELDSILIESRRTHMLSRLMELNLLDAIHTDLIWDEWLHDIFESLPGELPDEDWELPQFNNQTSLYRALSYVIWLLRLSERQVKSIAKRLKLPQGLVKAALAASELWRVLPAIKEASPSDIVDQLEDNPPLSRYAVYLATSDPQLKGMLEKYAVQWRKIRPYTTGHHLLERGLPPGPTYRTILKAIRDAWLDGQVTSQEGEKRLLEQLLDEPDSDVNNK